MIRRAFAWIGSELFPQGSDFRPESPDVMLVSYPKSGNTWVRALVAYLVGEQRTLKEMDHLVPDIYTCRGAVLRNAYRFPCSGRLIKSHESFRPTYKRIIYVVRDPRDVCVSYYHFLGGILRTLDPESTGLDEFANRFVAGDVDDYGTWGEHAGSWLTAERADFLTIRYEDLLAGAEQCLVRICDFLGLECDESAISNAVENCSIARLRSKEASERTVWHPIRKADASAAFFREGGSSARNNLDQASVDRICDAWRQQMEAFGYLP